MKPVNAQHLATRTLHHSDQQCQVNYAYSFQRINTRTWKRWYHFVAILSLERLLSRYGLIVVHQSIDKGSTNDLVLYLYFLFLLENLILLTVSIFMILRLSYTRLSFQKASDRTVLSLGSTDFRLFVFL